MGAGGRGAGRRLYSGQAGLASRRRCLGRGGGGRTAEGARRMTATLASPDGAISPAREAPALEIRGLKKSFGPAEIIRGVDLAIPKGRASRRDRPERRRQVDAVQPHQRPDPAHCRRGAARRRAITRPACLQDQPARAVAVVPGHQHLSQDERVGERALRRAVGQGRKIHLLARH